MSSYAKSGGDALEPPKEEEESSANAASSASSGEDTDGNELEQSTVHVLLPR